MPGPASEVQIPTVTETQNAAPLAPSVTEAAAVAQKQRIGVLQRLRNMLHLGRKKQMEVAPTIVSPTATPEPSVVPSQTLTPDSENGMDKAA